MEKNEITPEEVEKETYKALERLKVPYKLYHHEPLFTIEAAEELDKKIGIEICKNLFLSTRHSTEFYFLLMQGHKKFHTGKVSKQAGVPRMTFADDIHMMKYLHIRPGSVSPLGLLNDKENHVKLLIDSDVLKMEKISVHPCVNTATVVIKTADLIEKILPACGHTYQEIIVE